MIDQIYLAGGLVRDPELRFTPNGNAVAQFSLAQSDYIKNDQGEWEQVAGRYVECSIWDDTRGQHPKQWAHAISELGKGTRIVVHGKLKTRSWETKEGEKRSRLEFAADSFYIDGLTGAPQPQQSAQSSQSDPWANAPAATGQDNGQPPF